MRVAFDTETCLITESEPIPELVCGSFAWSPTEAGVTLDVLPTVRDLISSGAEFCGVNIAFDWQVLVRAGLPIEDVFALYEQERVRDPAIDWFLDDVANGRSTKHPYSLAESARVWLGKHRDKGEDTWRLRYSELRGVPLESWPIEAYSYAREDAIDSLALANKIPESKDSRRQAAWAWWLALAGTQGIRTDPERVARLRSKTIVEVAEYAAKLPDNWISWAKDGRLVKHEKRIREYIDARGMPHPTTESGLPSLGYEDLQDTGDPDLQAYGELKSKLSVLDSDLTYLSRPRVRTRYWMAETGRTTSSGGKGSLDCYTNLQNIKTSAGIRECLIPEPGHVLLIADYEGLELCTIAQCCMALLGKSTIRDLLIAGRDLHSVLGARYLKIDYDTMIKRKKDPEDKAAYNARQFGKIGNFGLAGGAGAEALRSYARIAYGVRITLEEASQIREIWREAYPEMREYLWLGNESVVEQLYVGRVRAGCSYTVSNNTKFQGLGGDITKAAGFQIAKACYADPSSPLFGARIAIFVHDEFVVSCPEERMIEGAAELVRLMTTGMPATLCPDVPLHTVPVIARRWSKKAKPVERDGRMVPWDD